MNLPSPKLLAIPALIAALSACSEFADEPVHRSSARAVRDTERTGDALSETQREPVGNNLNLLAVNFGGKNTTPEVQTILDPLKQPPTQVQELARPITPASTAPTYTVVEQVGTAPSTAPSNPLPALA